MFSEHNENPPYFISNILPAKGKVYMSDCFGSQVNTKEDVSLEYMFQVVGPGEIHCDQNNL